MDWRQYFYMFANGMFKLLYNGRTYEIQSLDNSSEPGEYLALIEPSVGGWINVKECILVARHYIDLDEEERDGLANLVNSETYEAYCNKNAMMRNMLMRENDARADQFQSNIETLITDVRMNNGGNGLIYLIKKGVLPTEFDDEKVKYVNINKTTVMP